MQFSNYQFTFIGVRKKNKTINLHYRDCVMSNIKYMYYFYQEKILKTLDQRSATFKPYLFNFFYLSHI